MANQSDNGRLYLNPLFWIIGYTLFLAFQRMFHVFLTIMYVAIMWPMLGEDSAELAFHLAFLSSYFFAIYALIWLYKEFKKHIAGG